MWTFVTLAGVMPLVEPSGAGAASRQAVSMANEVKGNAPLLGFSVPNSTPAQTILLVWILLLLIFI